MRVRRGHLLRLLAALALLAGLLVLLGACAGGDQNTFAAEGDVARKQRDLLIIWILGPAAVILVLVQGALIYALVRYRRKSQDEVPNQVHGNTRLEIAWTIAPAILLLVIAVPTIMGVIDIGRDARADALQVNVTAFQFDWQFEYPDLKNAEGKAITITGTCLAGKCAELHIPVGQEISVSLESLDVIHSFWVPKLAGKLDAVPGRENRMWFNATRPGSYSGQCAEFCGLGHADMRLVVVAESEEDFQAWVADQLAGGAASAGSGSDELVSRGE